MTEKEKQQEEEQERLGWIKRNEEIFMKYGIEIERIKADGTSFMITSNKQSIEIDEDEE